VVRACLSQLASISLAILVIALARNTLVAEPLQRDLPYFVDAAGTEYDVEQEAKVYDSMRGLSPAEEHEAILRNSVRRLQRWRVYLRNDGTWAPDPVFGKQDYADQHYPVEYLLPLGYRGAFQVAWGVAGAPPLEIVNNKVEIYIPASGVYETSSALSLTTGAVASPEHQFYFEHDGKRDVIPHEPLKPGQTGIHYGTTACRAMPQMCYTYFVGSWEEWQAARSAQCPTPEAELQAAASGHDCSDVQPGSTQPVAEIVAPHGKPAILPNEFHGRTLNGRRVTLSMGPSKVTSWRFDGPEPAVPDEPVLAAELKAHITAILAPSAGTKPDRPGCSQEEMRSLLQASAVGPYRFFRTPYSSKVLGQFLAPETSRNAPHATLVFARGEQGWKLVRADCHVNRRQYEMVSGLNTKVSEFVGKAIFRQTEVVLRNDGTWDSDDPSELQLPAYTEKTFTAYDMNGGELQLTMDDGGRGTWRRLSDPTLQITTDRIISELVGALDRYIDLLSAGNIAGYLAEGGLESENQAREIYRQLEKLGDDSKEANEVYDFLKQTAEGESIFKDYGANRFKAAMKKRLLEGAIQSVDLPSTLQELKKLRKARPRIAPRTPFSQDFEALYTLSQEGPAPSQATSKMTGHGSTWALHRE
jgi:hypothetical protein